MKYLKLYESFEEDDLGLIDLVGSKCSVSISIGTKYDCKNEELIPLMIKDYKEMYIRNKEWSGGPCNKEWLEKYHKDFNTSFSNAYHAWKPVVFLNIKTENFGTAKMGFSIYNKKISVFNYGEMKVKSDYYQKSLDNLKNYINREIYTKNMEFDDVISFLDLDCDFYYNSIIEDNKLTN